MDKPKIRYRSYQHYLSSDQWKSIKKDFEEKSNMFVNACFFCGSQDSVHHHHWRYAKDWNDDSYDNLIMMCSLCHYDIHNIESDFLRETLYNCDDFISYISVTNNLFHKRNQ
jgi:hypothetical protein